MALPENHKEDPEKTAKTKVASSHFGRWFIVCVVWLLTSGALSGPLLLIDSAHDRYFFRAIERGDFMLTG